MKSFFSITFLALSMFGSLALAQQPGPVPKLINYQGKLVQANGTDPLEAGTYVLRFELFDKAATPAAGEAPQTLVWGEEQQVVVTGGIFHVMLGAPGATPLAGTAVNDLGFAFGSADRFLQTTIVSGPAGAINQTLAPRQQLASVPFAMTSGFAKDAAHEIPVGGIIMWWGALEKIPNNFELCDGSSPASGSALIGLKPDLRGRFARGAPSGTPNVINPAVSGGVDTLDLDHTHGAGSYIARILGPTAVAGSESIWYERRGGAEPWNPNLYYYARAEPVIEEAATTTPRSFTLGTAVAGRSDGGTLGNVDNRPAFTQVFYIIRVN